MSLLSRSIFSILFVCSLLSATVLAGGEEPWRPVSAAELAMKTSQVEPNADAEALFWEVRVNDSTQNITEENYLRVKIFTEAGREKYSKVDIPYSKGSKIKDIRARIIKPDGSIIELNKTDIFEREILKANDVKIKAVSFAVPNLETGVILEYQYTELTKNAGIEMMPVFFQHDIPVRDIKFFIKPYDGRYPMKYMSFNTDDAKFVKDKKGFYVASMTNVPALRDEPYMPPSEQVRKWMLVYKDYSNGGSAENYWGIFARARSRWYKSFQPKDDVKNIVPQIIGDAATPDEKVSRIFQFCKTQIQNVTYDPKLTAEERDNIAEDIENARDALKERRGSAIDINTLFGALVTAAGFEARYVYTGDRSRFFFTPAQAHSRFVHLSAIAVNTGNGWKFYDPGSYFVPEGMLQWHDEKQHALLIGKDNSIWMKTLLSGPEKSVARRTGRFTLSEDGTLEGTVKVEFTGHLSERYKRIYFDKSQGKREESLTEALRSRMTTAEVSGISIENANDPEKPFQYEYKVRIPNYAQRTGKRLFVQPGFFEYGVKPVFSASSRTHDIYFSYPWQENDVISITFPKGYELDNADMPAPVFDTGKISSLNISIGINKVTNTLYYKREFYFGANDTILFPARFYEAIKGLFDQFHAADAHTITLRQS